MTALPLPVFEGGDWWEEFVDIDRLGGWGLAGLGLALMVLVLALSLGIAFLWQKWRDPRRS